MPDYITRGPYTTDIGTRLVRDVDDKIFYLNPSAYPLYAIARQAKKNAKKVTNIKFESYTIGSPYRKTQVNYATGYTSTDTAIVVDDATVATAKETVVNISTGEVMQITAVDTGTNTWTVTRHIGDASGTDTIADNDVLVVLGTAMEQMSGKPDVITRQPVAYFNYIETIRTPFELPTDVDLSNPYGGSEAKRLRTEKAIDHLISIESKFIWGKKDAKTVGNAPVYFTDGVLNAISTSTNNWNVGGTLTKAAFDTHLMTVMKYGNARKVKIGLANNIALTAINGFANNNIIIRQSEKFFGWTFQEYHAGNGRLLLFQHALLDEYYSTGRIIIVDPDYIGYRYMQKTTYTQIPPRSDSTLTDGSVCEFLTKCGLWIPQPLAHADFYGITG